MDWSQIIHIHKLFTFMNRRNVSLQIRIFGETNNTLWTWKRLILPIMNWIEMFFHFVIQHKLFVTYFTTVRFFTLAMGIYHVIFQAFFMRESKSAYWTGIRCIFSLMNSFNVVYQSTFHSKTFVTLYTRIVFNTSMD